jgi:hypothetical protein
MITQRLNHASQLVEVFELPLQFELSLEFPRDASPMEQTSRLIGRHPTSPLCDSIPISDEDDRRRTQLPCLASVEGDVDAPPDQLRPDSPHLK